MNIGNASKEVRKRSKALAYARVSSKEQDKEGFSIAAQQKLLQTYALQNTITIEKEFVDVETAKTTGRTSFTEMVSYIKKHPNVRTVLVEKTDRLYRNLKDWILLDELDIEIHLVKEGEILSRDSRSSEKCVHGIKVLMAKQYIDNLSEEARKGQQEKAEQGIWPTKAPIGYRNVLGPEGKRIISPDTEVAAIIVKIFDWYAPGILSLEEVADKAHGVGLVCRRTGTPVPVSAIHTILHNRIYCGEFDWKGQTYKGRHTPLISIELFERVQDTLARRGRKKVQKPRKGFAFSSLVTCGHCGCALTGDVKKGRYVYYRCTGYKGKCPEPYVREEVLAAKYSELLKRLDVGEHGLELVATGLKSSQADQAREHNEALKRLQGEYDRIQGRLQAMYVDKLDGKIDAALFDRFSVDWRKAQDRCLREIERLQAADESYFEQGITLLEMATNAQRLFDRQTAEEKRKLLNFVVSNSSWRDGELTVTLRQPFDLIAEMSTVSSCFEPAEGRNLADHSGWLPFLNTYRTMCLAPQPDFRLVLEEVRGMQVAA